MGGLDETGDDLEAAVLAVACLEDFSPGIDRWKSRSARGARRRTPGRSAPTSGLGLDDAPHKERNTARRYRQ